MYVGRRIYYEIETGNIVLNTGERKGVVSLTTIEQDVKNYIALSKRNRDTFDVLELEYGQYAQDFAESNGYRVNSKTKELEFSYPDPNEPEGEPVYQKPLTEQVTELESRTKATEDALLAIMMSGGV